MKTLHKILFATVLLGTVSCKEEFLQTEPTELISANQIAEASALNPGLQSLNRPL